jgi:glycosyltransferase involved in cell wall biosynthesis
VVPYASLELATGLPVRMPDGLGSLHTGRLDGRMREVYQRSSVVALAIHPTLTASGLTVILEAMSSGRPVVVTDNPGLDDYVEHGVTGVLVPPGNRDAFAEALSSLLLDPERAARMGAAAAERVRERFTSAGMSEVLARIARRVGTP